MADANNKSPSGEAPTPEEVMSLIEKHTRGEELTPEEMMRLLKSLTLEEKIELYYELSALYGPYIPEAGIAP